MPSKPAPKATANKAKPKSEKVKYTHFANIPIAPKRRPGRPHMPILTEENVRAALIKYCGLYTMCGQALGVTRTAIKEFVNRRPALKDLATEHTEQFLDIAENSLRQAVEAGEVGAICFALKCLGKQRGYIEKPAELPPLEMIFTLLGLTAAQVAELRAHIAAGAKPNPVPSANAPAPGTNGHTTEQIPQRV